MSTDTQINQLIINKLTAEQYATAKAAGQINETELYMITDEGSEKPPFYVVTTAGTAPNYTATIDGLTALTNGMLVCINIHTGYTGNQYPTLNINGLGAKSIGRNLSNAADSEITNTQIGGYIFYEAGTPILLQYSESGGWGRWIVVSHTIPSIADLDGDTFTKRVNAVSNATVSTSQLRNISAGTTDLTAGTSSLATGTLYFVYE